MFENHNLGAQQNPTYKTAAPLIINIDAPWVDALHERMNKLIQNPLPNPTEKKA